MISNPRIGNNVCTISTVTQDFHFHGPQDTRRFDAVGKVAGAFKREIGGSGINIGKQILGMHPAPNFVPITILPDGPVGRFLSGEIRSYFPQFRPVYCPVEPRVSFILNERTFLSRPTLNIDELPERVQPTIAGAKIVFVGPLSVEDSNLARHCLQLSNRTILQLSNEQLSNEELAYELISRSHLVALNQSEIEDLTGCKNDVEQAVWHVHQQTGANVIVSNQTEIVCLVDGKVSQQCCFVPKAIVQTSGAGDALLATFAFSKFIEEVGTERSLFFSAAASCRHVEGLSPIGKGRLCRWVEGKKTMSSTTSRRSRLTL